MDVDLIPEPTRRSLRERCAYGVLAFALALFATWWVGPPHTWDGPVLLTLTASHGVHLGDLPAIPVFLFAGWLFVTRAIIA